MAEINYSGCLKSDKVIKPIDTNEVIAKQAIADELGVSKATVNGEVTIKQSLMNFWLAIKKYYLGIHNKDENMSLFKEEIRREQTIQRHFDWGA